MFKESSVNVKSSKLIDLQTELRQLSKNLLDTYDFISTNLKNLNEEWQDDKYDEFEQEFRSSKEEIREISEKYAEFADIYLPPRIEVIQEAEKINMGIK